MVVGCTNDQNARPPVEVRQLFVLGRLKLFADPCAQWTKQSIEVPTIGCWRSGYRSLVWQRPEQVANLLSRFIDFTVRNFSVLDTEFPQFIGDPGGLRHDPVFVPSLQSVPENSRRFVAFPCCLPPFTPSLGALPSFPSSSLSTLTHPPSLPSVLPPSLFYLRLPSLPPYFYFYSSPFLLPGLFSSPSLPSSHPMGKCSELIATHLRLRL